MNYIVKVREIIKAMRPTGTFRLTVETDQDRTVPRPLCSCVGGHSSIESARGCPEAIRLANGITMEDSFQVEVPVLDDDPAEADRLAGIVAELAKIKVIRRNS